jgi:hypothetical protein
MNIDNVQITRSCPKLSIFLRRVRATITGRPYFFNRQKMRLQVFRDINTRIPFDTYIETGTYLGMTTHFFAKTARVRGAQVYSCEIDGEYFEIAASTVGNMKNVHLHHCDSIEFVRSLSSKVSNAVNFVYLDAHWYEHLPLRDELSLIGGWQNTIVMIDDFKVPFDEEFVWDRYDEDREICMQYIEGSIGSSPIYFPNYPAKKEGAVSARGYCVIPTCERYANVLDGIQLLRRFK